MREFIRVFPCVTFQTETHVHSFVLRPLTSSFMGFILVQDFGHFGEPIDGIGLLVKRAYINT